MTKKTPADEAVEALEAYKELKRRLENQAPITTGACTAVEVYDRTGTKPPPEIIDIAIGEYRKLLEIEEAIEPLYELGFPVVQYERPDLEKKITVDTTDPWEEWRKGANIVRDNSDTGRRF